MQAELVGPELLVAEGLEAEDALAFRDLCGRCVVRRSAGGRRAGRPSAVVLVGLQPLTALLPSP